MSDTSRRHKRRSHTGKITVDPSPCGALCGSPVRDQLQGRTSVYGESEMETSQNKGCSQRETCWARPEGIQVQLRAMRSWHGITDGPYVYMHA